MKDKELLALMAAIIYTKEFSGRSDLAVKEAVDVLEEVDLVIGKWIESEARRQEIKRKDAKDHVPNWDVVARGDNDA